MEIPDINLAHADLNKYNQAPNYLANQVTIHIAIYIYIYIYIYIMWHFKKATQSLSAKDRKYIFFIIFLSKFYKHTTLRRLYKNFLNVF